MVLFFLFLYIYIRFQPQQKQKRLSNDHVKHNNVNENLGLY